jgi:hypothetical protein
MHVTVGPILYSGLVLQEGAISGRHELFLNQTQTEVWASWLVPENLPKSTRKDLPSKLIFVNFIII